MMQRTRQIASSAGIALMLAGAPAFAQPRPDPEPNALQRIGNWFERQFDSAGRTLKGAGGEVENFGREAGVAARSTVDATKDAAGAVVALPKARVISGRADCVRAPNGAADCAAAATKICRANGFESGRSLDTTTAETCPPRVLLSGREPQPGECRTDTFVNRALCQ